jgi:phosphatidylglycerol:prolipoprotein diacylglycerol transferase
MLPYLNLGPLGLPTAPLIYLAGAWLALYAVDRAARRLGQAAEPVYALATVALLAGFIGARLLFVLLHWSSYDDNLLGIIWPLTSGYNAAGGAVIAAAAAFFYGRWRRLPLWPPLDALAPGLLIFLMAVSLADFLGGAGYGSLTAMPWGIDQFGVRRHAVQLYEVAAGAAALGVWWAATSSSRKGPAGRAFLLAVAVYAAGRLFVDAFKETTPLTSGGFHILQIVALITMLLVLILLARTIYKAPHEAHED